MTPGLTNEGPVVTEKIWVSHWYISVVPTPWIEDPEAATGAAIIPRERDNGL